MEFEMLELIKEARTQLRRNAGLASYDPDDPILPNLPTLSESIAQIDPSPPYLRCKRCHGRLLRDLQSVVCVYCGKNQKNEVPPDPIAFRSTSGYRWLLDALGLDGSEIVGPSAEEIVSNKGHNALKEELPLSELLDLEIKWPGEDDKDFGIVSNQSPLHRNCSVNLTEVDLDNFFNQSRKDVWDSPQVHSGTSTQKISEATTASQTHEKPFFSMDVQPTFASVRPGKDEEKDNDSAWRADFKSASFGSTFENFKPSMSSRDKEGDYDSAWKADFKSAGSDYTFENPESCDPFVVSSNDISTQMDPTSGFGSDKKAARTEVDIFLSASVTSERDQVDLWNNFNPSASNLAEQTKNPVGSNESGPVGNSNSPSSTVDWVDNNPISREASDLKETGLNGFSQPVPFSDALYNRSISKQVNVTLPENFLLYRKNDVREFEAEASNEHVGAGLDCDATQESKCSDAEILMSQMHDLSFMLNNTLSIPAKSDESGSHSQMSYHLSFGTSIVIRASLHFVWYTCLCNASVRRPLDGAPCWNGVARSVWMKLS